MVKEKVINSRTKQFKNFMSAHKGETFTATGLAKALGWTKKKTKMIKGEDGKAVEDVIRISHNSKTIVRLARRFGVVRDHKEHFPPKKPGDPEIVGHWVIVF